MREMPLVGSVRRELMDVASWRFGMAWLAAMLAVAVYGLGLVAGLGDAPLFLLVVPLSLGSVHGTNVGVALGVFTAGLACAWWLQEGTPGGIPWVVSRCATCVVIGAALGHLTASRQRLASQLQHHRDLSLDLIATASFEGYFTDVNPAFTRTLGYTREELLSRPFLDFVHLADREPTLAAAAEQTEAGHEVLSFQNRYRCSDGSYRWLEWNSQPDASTQTLIAVARDITDRKRLEDHERSYQVRLEHEVALRTRELEGARQETVERLALAAEYHDDETRRHTARVGETAAQIAVALGLDTPEVEVIREAALLHDVGKLGVSDRVLLKPGRLTTEEFEHVKRHAEIGASILSGSSSDVLRVSEEVARSHHERWDGSGYPAGLKGEAIPLPARIVALADVFDALTHTRPYKEAGPVDVAVSEIHRLSGRAFDPAIVAAFDTLDPIRLAGIPRPESAAWEATEQSVHASVSSA